VKHGYEPHLAASFKDYPVVEVMNCWDLIGLDDVVVLRLDVVWFGEMNGGDFQENNMV
jgi:hypothetical protein